MVTKNSVHKCCNTEKKENIQTNYIMYSNGSLPLLQFELEDKDDDKVYPQHHKHLPFECQCEEGTSYGPRHHLNK